MFSNLSPPFSTSPPQLSTPRSSQRFWKFLLRNRLPAPFVHSSSHTVKRVSALSHTAGLLRWLSVFCRCSTSSTDNLAVNFYIKIATRDFVREKKKKSRIYPHNIPWITVVKNLRHISTRVCATSIRVIKISRIRVPRSDNMLRHKAKWESRDFSAIDVDQTEIYKYPLCPHTMAWIQGPPFHGNQSTGPIVKCNNNNNKIVVNKSLKFVVTVNRPNTHFYVKIKPLY